MKRLYALVIITGLIALQSAAQAPSIQWQKTIGSTYSDNGRAIRQTPDGGYIVAGRVNSYGRDVSQPCEVNNAWLVKLNSTGVIEWEKNFGLVGNDIINSIGFTSDGGYILAGFTSLAVGWQGNEDFLVIKVNATGNLVWQKTFGGSSDDRAHSIQQTSDGGYIVAGETSSADGQVVGQHGQWDSWVLKLDASGNMSWQKTMGGTGAESAFSIQQTTDGGYIVAGSAQSNNGDVSGLHGGNADWWVVKLNSAGSISWQKCFGSTLTESAYSVIQTSDGGYAVTGYAAYNDGDVVAPTFLYDHFWIIKTDASGNLSWQKVYGGNGYDVARSIRQTTDGGYIVAGHSDSPNSGNVNGNASYIFDNVWVIRLNTSGSLLWQKKMGGELQDQAWDVRQTTDGGYVIVGNTNSTTGDVSPRPNDFDLWVVKLGPDGALPVTFQNFSAALTEGAVRCKWQTLNETNTRLFEIERSVNGNDFINVGTVNAVGNSTQPTDYSFDDLSISSLTGKLFYRLRIVDNDGRTTLSGISAVEIRKTADIRVFPNPTNGNVHLNFHSKGGNTLFVIRDIRGKVVARSEVNLSPGYQSHQMDVSSLPPGTYTITAGDYSAVSFVKL